MRARQLSFFPAMKIRTRLDHGGDIGAGKRKIRRPFDPKRPLHVVLRSSRARGTWSLLHPRNEAKVSRLLRMSAHRHDVRVYRFANVGNHLHLLVSARTRKNLQDFLRVFAGGVAFQVTGAKKTNRVGKFWDKLVYSRVVSWGAEFKAVSRYLVGNLFEAAGAWKSKETSGLKLILLSMREAGVGPPVGEDHA